MGYYTQQQLEPRINQLGLQPLWTLLQGVANGRQEWSRSVSVSVPDPNDIELVRNVLYSMLHLAGIKPLFKVMRLGTSLVIEKKVGTQQVGVRFMDGQEVTPEHLEPLGDEGLEEDL